MCTRTLQLPNEIHLHIGQYVRRDDLASYRLASKLLLSIGTAELFGTLTFHFSTASLARLASISNSEHLRKHVKTVFLDVNLWRIREVNDLVEWEAYFCRQSKWLRECYGSDSANAQAARYELLAQNRKEWVAYLEKVSDERVVRRDPSRLDALERFHNLQTIHVVCGQLVPAHRGIKKVGNEVHSASKEPVTLCRGQGVNDYGNQVGKETFESLLRITIPSLKKLKLDRINYTNFDLHSSGHFTNLKSLDIKITARADGWYGPVKGPYVQSSRAARLFHQGKLRPFLLQTRSQLECLKIDLDCGHEKIDVTSRQPLADIQDAFDTFSIWPRLRKLSLCHFFATPETLISLLARHRGTLKDLRLRNITLSRESDDDHASLVVSAEKYTWPQIFRHLAGCLDLQHATLSGQLTAQMHCQETMHLDANPEFAAAISDYLVSGGECPWGTFSNSQFITNN